MQHSRSDFLTGASALLFAAPAKGKPSTAPLIPTLESVADPAEAVAAGLRLSPVLQPRIKAGRLRIISATYGLESGRVAFAAG